VNNYNVTSDCQASHEVSLLPNANRKRYLEQEKKMIYSIQSQQFAAFMFTGRKTPTTDEVCDALNAIKEAYPTLEATDVSRFSTYLKIVAPTVY